ncbi:methyltransferase domain-containing protein [Flavilitoribacter nigricans]|uniref:Arsenite methyltransferase n=1 Tax=Flavilitoribacter nigricans (strain ATCC 23147 / DSM 23189 / NBRC 102662 / NCIMB 1420 / SS-2) TaxID=1122177 RepID=A0A2D0NAB6_FLAN2|nr:methyltransferase domain-containing protein [Flavilitoribacter nigricans]PHN05427.1 methyltransferase type 11 [Flavilitoribacter nigricans DSM 23189 = NBRC 102662]
MKPLLERHEGENLRKIEPLKSDHQHLTSPPKEDLRRPTARQMGYPDALISRIPAGAISSFTGVGYFFHLVELRPGERVVDLGCGSGTDSFIAALYTGVEGSVVGLDMSTELLEKARNIRDAHQLQGIEFYAAKIDRLPLPDASTDMVISNGAIHRASNKAGVFREIGRILQPGGRLVFADIVVRTSFPGQGEARELYRPDHFDGAVMLEAYIQWIEAAGMKMVIVEDNSQYGQLLRKKENCLSRYGLRSISLLAIKQ